MKQAKAEQIIKETKENYNALARDFSNTRAFLWKEFQDLLVYIKNGDRVLDLGCGNGRLAELFKNRPVEYVGVDNSEELISLAKKNQPVKMLKEPKFFVADALNLPFRPSDFNEIFSTAVLHHIPSYKLRLKFLQDCYSYLKPGGYLLLTVWNFYQPRLLMKYKIWSIIFGFHKREFDRGDVVVPWKMPIVSKGEKLKFKIFERYYHAFTEGELQRLVSAAGFQVIDHYYVCKGKKTNWIKGFNLVLIAQKQ
ncbi:MAG: methyltransferase domain-containing protein [Patescibacteria group bacterium]|nr:methyltransferase domain-containing protein [Patescibacteria group bacterium]MDD5121657.1 methyltransferase domain-containing protein [Patescibacteria group bacterium]MDD5222125.1 methyltransferase domain-containing protein [Patescibacteria group bacterium]MDD5396179.1 methyltransferase domain-containing protein [Patescibacteria group bacterium]